MIVARVVDRPPSAQPTKRLPRPDDPIPRKPPAFFIRDQLKRTASSNTRDLKRTASTSAGGVGSSKRVKLTEENAASSSYSGKQVFKVPEVPSAKSPAGSNAKSSKGKGKEKDVFGDITEILGSKDKQKTEGGQPMSIDENTLEKGNKNVCSCFLLVSLCFSLDW